MSFAIDALKINISLFGFLMACDASLELFGMGELSAMLIALFVMLEHRHLHNIFRDDDDGARSP